MATFETGNMWSAYNGKDPFIFTANNTIDRRGWLVMGAGMARQVKYRYNYVAEFFGSAISQLDDKDYLILLHPGTMIAALQVKRHFRDKALLPLVDNSIRMLKTWAINSPNLEFNLNYPGIGYGKLALAEVEPLLAPLPDNVRIWRCSRGVR
jgi:hypothetical protein